jgi:hypothetical protein
MTKQIGNNADKDERPAHQVRLPGFIKNEEIGLAV